MEHVYVTLVYLKFFSQAQCLQSIAKALKEMYISALLVLYAGFTIEVVAIVRS